MIDDNSLRAPYPGLRAFRREETDLFFGREDSINTLVDRLAATRFLSVLGSSGTGKSSLVKTGLLDALELGLMAKAGSRWKIVEFRPGGAPLKHLARELLATENPGQEIADKDVDLLRAYLARGPRSIVEWCRAGHLPPGTNLLLLVDQFEELFRYSDYAGREEAEAFVALLLESAREADVPIYVTITMRSEYLGACALIEGLSDAINAGMYLTPRMSREQCREAIVGPAAVCNIDIEPALVNRLLNDLATFAPWDDRDSNDQLDRIMRRADQLPLLQYTLNRMWLRARERTGADRIQLTVDDYNAIGGLSGALNAHANQIFEELGKARRPVIEWIFRALTQGSTLADAVRRPTRFDELVAACGGNEPAVRAVVDAFRAPGVNFLVPELDPKNPAIPPDTYVDISHESLIRQWKKLSEWLEAEGRAAQQWRRLIDRYNSGEMLRGRELANLVAWRGETKPNASWAKRYGGDYATVIAFLDKSQRVQSRKRAAMVVSAAAVFVLIAIEAVVATAYWFEASRALERADRALERAEAEQARAETNKAQVTELLDTLIFNIGQRLTASERGSSQTMSARHARDTEPEAQKKAASGANRPSATGSRDEGQTPEAATQTTEATPQSSGDRETSQTEESTNTGVMVATTILENVRKLVANNPQDIEIRRLYAVSLNTFGEVKLHSNDLTAAEQAFKTSVAVLEELLATDPDRSLWQDDLTLALSGMARVMVRQNRNADARAHFERSIGMGRKLALARPDERMLHNFQIHLGSYGDVLVQMDMRPDAIKIFEERLSIRRKLYSAAPKSIQRYGDVSIALDRVGQLIRDIGDVARSRKYFEEALEIDQVIYKRTPNRRVSVENLVFSLGRIGDVDRQLGNLKAAVKPYQDAIELQRRLVAHEPDAAGPQRTLASLYNRLGDTHRRLKSFKTALTFFTQELAVRRKVLAANKTDIEAQRSVASALDALGNAMRESGDTDGAHKAFVEQLQIDRSLLKSDPEHVQRLIDVTWSLNRLGDLERQLNRWAEADSLYVEALSSQRKLVARDPNNMGRQRALATLLGKLGETKTRIKILQGALLAYREQLDVRQVIVKREPTDIQARRDLALSYDYVGNTYRDMGDLANALKSFEGELEIDRGIYSINPDDSRAMLDLSWTLNKLGDFQRRLKDLKSARASFEEVQTIERRLLDREPTVKARHRKFLDGQSKLAGLLVDMNEIAAARQAYVVLADADERWLAVATELHAKKPTDETRADLIQANGDAGWHSLLAGRAEPSMRYSEAALKLDDSRTWIKVNLGHAYLFVGRIEDAREIYIQVRDVNRTSDGKRKYSHEIRDDFALFRRLGIGVAAMDRMAKEIGI